MFKNLFTLFFCGAVLCACSSPQQKQLEKLQDDVLALHDEIMPQMGELVALKEKLNSKNNALIAADDPEAAESVILNGLVITNLDQSYENMMSWMRGFRKVDLSGDPSANREYLEEQMAKIQTVKSEVDEAIASAQDALNN